MLGDELRAARLAANWSQETLAEEAGISRNYVSLLELNRKSPTVDVLLRVCRALGISAAGVIERILPPDKELKLPRAGRRRARARA